VKFKNLAMLFICLYGLSLHLLWTAKSHVYSPIFVTMTLHVLDVNLK
jgi:hypothetical protein